MQKKTKQEKCTYLEKDKLENKSEDKSENKTKSNDEKPVIRRAHLIGSKLCLIRRTPDESLDVYLKRVGYIGKKLNSNMFDMTDNMFDISNLTTNSIIWRNHTIYGMSYPTTVLRRL